jgi:hypothetical protein
MTTIDLIDVFFRQSIIGIDPIDVFLTIGAHLCLKQSFIFFANPKLHDAYQFSKTLSKSLDPTPQSSSSLSYGAIIVNITFYSFSSA